MSTMSTRLSLPRSSNPHRSAPSARKRSTPHTRAILGASTDRTRRVRTRDRIVCVTGHSPAVVLLLLGVPVGLQRSRRSTSGSTPTARSTGLGRYDRSRLAPDFTIREISRRTAAVSRSTSHRLKKRRGQSVLTRDSRQRLRTGGRHHRPWTRELYVLADPQHVRSRHRCGTRSRRTARVAPRLCYG
jgi:uncharacterized protein (DUF2126 family)